MMGGLFMLLYVGGLVADELHSAYAANGGNDGGVQVVPETRPASDSRGAQAIPETRPASDSRSVQAGTPTESPLDSIGVLKREPLDDPDVSNARPAPPLPTTTPQPAVPPPQARLPVESEPQDVLSNVVPAHESRGEPSTVTRIVIPAIKVDKKVVEVGWTVQQDADGQAVAIWDVEKYRVGHHKGSSNPGGGGNIVLAGHSGGWVYPFNDLYYLKPGDDVQLYSAGQLYDYTVSEHILVDEVGQPLDKRRENARYIEPTEEEMVTMVACWPLSGPNKFSQRIIIRAKPASAVQPMEDLPNQQPSQGQS